MGSLGQVSRIGETDSRFREEGQTVKGLGYRVMELPGQAIALLLDRQVPQYLLATPALSNIPYQRQDALPPREGNR